MRLAVILAHRQRRVRQRCDFRRLLPQIRHHHQPPILRQCAPVNVRGVVVKRPGLVISPGDARRHHTKQLVVQPHADFAVAGIRNVRHQGELLGKLAHKRLEKPVKIGFPDGFFRLFKGKLPGFCLFGPPICQTRFHVKITKLLVPMQRCPGQRDIGRQVRPGQVQRIGVERLQRRVLIEQRLKGVHHRQVGTFHHASGGVAGVNVCPVAFALLLLGGPIRERQRRRHQPHAVVDDNLDHS